MSEPIEVSRKPRPKRTRTIVIIVILVMLSPFACCLLAWVVCSVAGIPIYE
jgi:hypothetical protein